MLDWNKILLSRQEIVARARETHGRKALLFATFLRKVSILCTLTKWIVILISLYPAHFSFPVSTSRHV